MESEHLERLKAMRDDNGMTWDLSGNDKACFAWAIERIAELERELLERANMTPEQVIKLCVRERAEERERCAEICRSHAQRALEKASGLKPTDDRYLIRSDTAMSLAAQISALGG